LDIVWLPDGGIGVIIVVESSSITVVSGSVKVWSMERPVLVVWVFTDDFHNVDFSTCWPSNSSDV